MAEAQMHTLLLQLTMPDTAVIKAAELALKPMLKSPASITILIQCLTNTATVPVPVRNIAAVILRARITGHYSTFAPPDRTQFKTILLTCLTSEPERAVRNAAVGVVAAVAAIEITHESNTWPELLQFIAAAAQDASPDARELAFSLLKEMTETVSNCLKGDFQNLAMLYASALADSMPKVQTAALAALGMIMSWLADEEEYIVHFAGLIPNLLKVAFECQQRGDEDTLQVRARLTLTLTPHPHPSISLSPSYALHLQTICDVLHDLTQCSSAAVTVHLPTIVEFCLSVLRDPNVELVTRDAAAIVISATAESKPKLMGKKCNIDSLIETCMVMIELSKESAAGALFDSNPAWKEDQEEDSDDEEDYDGPTQCGMAQGTLDMLAIQLPQKVFFQTCITKCVQKMQSPDPAVRKSGIASLGVVAEGCQEKLTSHLAEIVPQVLRLGIDADTQVRECCCFALGQLAEHCQPEILDYSDTVLPTIFKLLEDPSDNVQVTSCYVLEMFCESLDPESVLPYLNPLMTRLVQMLEHSTKKSVTEMTVAAIAATAVAAEKEFAPYLPGVASIMTRLMNLTEEDQWQLKGRALECMGHMAVAVEKEPFRPYFMETIRVAGSVLTLDNPELHEYAYAVFANLAKVMEREFSPCLADLVPHLLEVVAKVDGGLELADPSEMAAQQAALSAFDDSDEEDGGQQQNFVVRTALLDTKRQALVALNGMASYCAQDFMPYLEQTTGILIGQVECKDDEYWHPAVVTEAMNTLAALVICSVSAHHEDNKVPWVKGDLATNPLSPHTTALVNAIMPALVKGLTNVDKEIVAAASEALLAVIDLCGPFSLATVANPVLQGILQLLTDKAPCQEGEDDEDDEDDEAEHDNFLNSVFDLVGGFAKAMGPQFAQYLPTFLAPIGEFCKSSRPTNDRSMAVGCLGEIAEGLGEAMAPHWANVFLPTILAGLGDEEGALRRNAAYTAGLCAEALGESIAPQYGQLLQALHPVFGMDTENSDNNACAVDNATSCVARMMMAAPSAFPYAQVLPVFLGSLPLKSDMTENEICYDALVKLWGGKQPDLVGTHQGDVMRIVQAAMADKKVQDDVKVKLKAAFGV